MPLQKSYYSSPYFKLLYNIMPKVDRWIIFINFTGHSFSYANQVTTRNLTATYPFIRWPGNVTINHVTTNQELIFECITLNCSHPPLLFIGDHGGYRPSLQDDDPDCIWGHPHSRSRDEGIWIFRKSLSLQEILTVSSIAATATLDTRIPVWCSTGDHNTERSYIHLISNLTPTNFTTPLNSTPVTSVFVKTTYTSSKASQINSATVSLNCKLLSILMAMVTIVVGIS